MTRIVTKFALLALVLGLVTSTTPVRAQPVVSTPAASASTDLVFFAPLAGYVATAAFLRLAMAVAAAEAEAGGAIVQAQSAPSDAAFDR